MRHFIRYVSLAVFVLAVTGCVETMGTSSVKTPPVKAYQPAPTTPGTLTPDQNLIVFAMDLARSGQEFTGPTLVLAQGARTQLKPLEPGFTVGKEGVAVGAGTIPGTQMVDVLSQRSDALGRTALVADRVEYTTRPPSIGETEQLTMLLQQDYKAVMTAADAGFKDDTRKAVTGYQQDKGLAADGLLGPGTAKTLAKDMEIIEIKSMRSVTLYPSKVRFELYVVPEGVVRSGGERFKHGFGSLEAVRAAAVPPERLDSEARKDGNFVIFVYFMDQVSPFSAIEVGFSTSPGKKDFKNRQATLDAVYAAPDSWPVIVAPFKLKDAGVRLYANVFVNDECVGNVKLK